MGTARKSQKTTRPKVSPKPKAKSRRDWSGKLLALLAAMIIYFYYQSAIQAEVSFVLPLEVSGKEGRIVNLHGVDEITLHLVGRAQDLKNLRGSDFETYVRLTPDGDGLRRLPVSYRLRNIKLGKNVSVQIEPPLVTLTVEKEDRRELPIEVSIHGYPATGFSLGTYRVSPKKVIVTGAFSALQKLQAISTKPIDITGEERSFQKLVELELPVLPGLNKPQKLRLNLARVQVEIQIEARSGTETFAIAPQVTNLPNNLKLLEILPKLVRLTLQGDSDVLQGIANGKDRVIIELDAGDIFSAGRYALPVVVRVLPAGISLLGSTPNRVSLVVNER